VKTTKEAANTGKSATTPGNGTVRSMINASNAIPTNPVHFRKAAILRENWLSLGRKKTIIANKAPDISSQAREWNKKYADEGSVEVNQSEIRKEVSHIASEVASKKEKSGLRRDLTKSINPIIVIGQNR